ncbi:MAG: hypothetical protein AAF333_04675 [Planctomycetota bacterium]
MPVLDGVVKCHDEADDDGRHNDPDDGQRGIEPGRERRRFGRGGWLPHRFDQDDRGE